MNSVRRMGFQPVPNSVRGMGFQPVLPAAWARYPCHESRSWIIPVNASLANSDAIPRHLQLVGKCRNFQFQPPGYHFSSEKFPSAPYLSSCFAPSRLGVKHQDGRFQGTIEGYSGSIFNRPWDAQSFWGCLPSDKSLG